MSTEPTRIGPCPACCNSDTASCRNCNGTGRVVTGEPADGLCMVCRKPCIRTDRYGYRVHPRCAPKPAAQDGAR